MIDIVPIEESIRIDLGITEDILTDAQIAEYIMRFAEVETTFAFQKVAPNKYRCFADCYIMDMAFTEEEDLSYTAYASGSIFVDATPGDDDSRNIIYVTGSRVDFREVEIAILIMLANTKCQVIAQSGAMGSISPQTVRMELMKQASVLRGVYSFG